MRILVTGGAGFIGSHYVRTMLSGGYPGYEDAAVTVLDKLTYAGNLANLAPVSASPRLHFVQGDIGDPALVRSTGARPRRGGQLRGRDSRRPVDRGAAPFVATNVAGVQVLLQACLDAGVGPVVHVSTDEVYGSDRVGLLDRAGAAAPELAVLGGEGRRRPARPGLRAHPRAGRARSPAAATTTAPTSIPRRSSRCS